MNKHSTMTASRLSTVLMISLGLLLCFLVGGSAIAATSLISQSKDATHAVIDADVSTGEMGRLELLKQYLATNADGIAQTHALTQSLGSYDQNKIVSVINGYAGRSGVTISGFDFDTATTGAGAAAASSAAKNTVNVTLASPVRYTNFIAFLKLLEQGLMPAQVIAGGVSSGSDDNSLVVVSPLSVKVAG